MQGVRRVKAKGEWMEGGRGNSYVISLYPGRDE